MEPCVHCSTPLPDGSLYCSQCGTPTSGGHTAPPTLTPQGREIFDRLTEATAGRYEVLRELGRGGMAVVFLAHQKSLDRLVAIKVLLPLLAYDPEIVERFMREAKTQGKLDHPNIIQVFEVYNESGLTFFSVPFISGMSLRTALKDDPRPPLNKIKRYLRQAADALAYAHRRGVVHRDVKPDNILIDSERDRVILTDFGIAKALAAETTLTTPGDLLGTPQYMSPEQGEGRQDLDGRADQYSLGLIGWEMLAGRRPFQADNLAELMYKHRFEEPDDIDSIRPDAPRNMRAAIKRAISKDRDQRFSNMDEFAAAMDAPDHVVIEVPTEKEPEAASEGGQTTTVRIPTPPSMRGTPTPRPGPEVSDEPTVKTPPSEPVEPAAIDEQETVLLSPTTRRQLGPQLGWIVGGVAAVAVVIAVIVLAEPFGAGADSEPTGSPVAEPTQPATDAGTSGPEAGGGEAAGESGGGEEAAGGGAGSGPIAAEGVRPPDAPGGGADESPGAVDSGAKERPPATDIERARAENARQSALARRAAAQADGAAELLAPLYDSLEAALRTADQRLAAADYAAANSLFSELIRGYAALRDSARNLAAADNPARDAADQVRAAALALRDSALAMGGPRFLPQETGSLGNRATQAQAAYDAGRYEEAERRFDELVGAYEGLIPRLTDLGEAAAEAAQQAMSDKRRTARLAGADERVPDQLAAADNLRNRAYASVQRGRYADAVDYYSQAGEAYTQIISDLAGVAGAESVEDLIATRIEEFRVLFEAEDLARIGTELYGGEVPGDDAKLMDYVFSSAENIRAVSRVERIEAAENTARADIRLDLDFRHQRTGQSGEMELRLRLEFESSPRGWLLTRIRNR